MRFSKYIPLFMLMLVSCKPSSRRAADYNDKIIAELKKVTLADDEFWRSVSDTGGDSMQVRASRLKMQLENSEKAIGAAEQFDEKDVLRKSSLEYIEHIKKALATDYGELINIAKNTERTQEDADRANKLMEESGKKRREAEDKLKAGQEAFAKDYNIKLEHK